MAKRSTTHSPSKRAGSSLVGAPQVKHKQIRKTKKGSGKPQSPKASATKQQGRDALIEKFQPFVISLIGKMIQAMSLPAENHDEYLSAGYLGLVEAAERYDPSTGADFRTYAYFRIRGAVIDYIRENSQLSGRAYRCARALATVNDMREGEVLGQGAGSSSRLQPKLEDVLDFAARGALIFRLSYGDQGADLTDVPSEDAAPDQRLEKLQEKKKIRSLLATLPEKERLIIEDYYIKGKSFVEIADENSGLSKSWISRLHTRAIGLLKERMLNAEAEML